MSASANPAGVDTLLVIDMQNSFLHSDGGLYQAMGASLLNIEDTVRRNREAVDSAVAANVPVIFTRQSYRPGFPDTGAQSPLNYQLTHDAPLLANTWDTEVVKELPTHHGWFLDKARMDAFYNTSLEVLLRGLATTKLAISGVVTNACVETTTRSAAMRDFEVTVLSDCCTTFSEQDQNASLSNLDKYGFATVRELSPTVFGSS